MLRSPDDGESVGAPTALSMAQRVRAAADHREPDEAISALLMIAVDLGICDSAGVIGELPRQELSPLLATDGSAAAADLAQCRRSAGPAVEALDSGRPVLATELAIGESPSGDSPLGNSLVSDTASGTPDDTGPAGPGVLGQGPDETTTVQPSDGPASFAAALAIPLDPERRLGVLTLYSRTPRTFSTDDLAVAGQIAAHLCVLLRHRAAVETLVQAIASRTVIGQAQGILMERHRLTAAQAFAVLTRCSQDGNVKLAALAQELTTTGRLPGLDRHVDPPAARKRPLT